MEMKLLIIFSSLTAPVIKHNHAKDVILCFSSRDRSSKLIACADDPPLSKHVR